MKKSLSTFGLILALATPAWGQVYFGQNKIQYADFDWQVLTTDHFQIYFYPEEGWLAEVAAHAAEESYNDLRIKFKHHIYSKVPIIVYSAGNYFTQTNTTPGMLPEGVAGFTEFFKGRVVLPFNGSYADFTRVLKHELVHVFTFSKLDYMMRTHHRVDVTPPPLWFTEGLAEHWSRTWGSEADLILRQMVLEDRLVDIRNMHRIHGSFYMYKVGESILQYWEDRFGDAAIARIFENWPLARSFDHLIELTFGTPLEVLDQEWAYHLKKKYYPELETLDLPDAVATPVSPPGFYMAPAPVCVSHKDSCLPEVVYLGNELGYSALFRQSQGKRSPRPLVRGGRSGRFELLHMFRAGIDTHDNGLVAFSSKSNDRDVLYIYDLVQRRVVDERRFRHLVSIVAPSFSPDGQEIVFTGAGKDGQHDLYILDRHSQDPPLRLTRDIYRDSEPVFTPDGQSIIFASDRGARGREGHLNLFEVELRTGTIRTITDTLGVNNNPTFLGPDTLMFVSDRAGSFDVYALVGDTALFRVTALSSGAFNPASDPASGQLFFATHTDFGYRIYSIGLRDVDWAPVPRERPPVQLVSWDVQRASSGTVAAAEGVTRYRRNFSVDIAQSAVSYDPVLGTIGGFQMALSDMLGDEYYYFLLSNVANNTSELLTSFNVAVTYLNRKHRINYGYGVYHLYDEIFNLSEGLFEERQAGGMAFVSYPLSRFRRVELSTFVRYSKRDWLTPPRTREGVLATPTLSLVYDNTLWTITGPIDGMRANVSAGFTYNLIDQKVLNRIAWADLRHYYRLGRQSAFATRLYAFMSGGDEPVRRYFGGSWDFRGYGRRSFFVRHIVFASNELRFPLLNNLMLDFPLGRLAFSGIKGALFFDVGSLWDEGKPLWLGSYGFGWRVALGRFMVLRFDLAKVTDFKTVAPGVKFDFFFGWNF